jgi:hypothetical protein
MLSASADEIPKALWAAAKLVSLYLFMTHERENSL